MQPFNQQVTLEGRYRSLLTLWFFLTLTIGILFLFTLWVSPSEETSENPTLSLTFLGLGILSVIASYFVKQRLLARSVNEQNVQMVYVAVHFAAALSEVAAILGIVDYLLTGHRHYYLLMIVALIGSLLNFPRRSHLVAASYKSPEAKDPWK